MEPILQRITFDPRYARDFEELNLDWIREYFKVESKDLEQVRNPQESILSQGGEIFFLLLGDQVVATCAALRMDSETYEIAKMAVRKGFRGQGLSNELMKMALEWIQGRGARKVVILSNTVLAPAISLYQKFGFQTVHRGAHPDYERCNIAMELFFDSSPSHGKTAARGDFQ